MAGRCGGEVELVRGRGQGQREAELARRVEHQLYIATAAAGHGLEDDAAVIKFYAALAGLELPAAPVLSTAPAPAPKEA